MHAGRPSLEVHLFDWNTECYDAHLRVNFLRKQRDAFESGRSSPDFVAEDYEVDFVGRFLPSDLTPLGRRQMGYDS